MPSVGRLGALRATSTCVVDHGFGGLHACAILLRAAVASVPRVGRRHRFRSQDRGQAQRAGAAPQGGFRSGAARRGDRVLGITDCYQPLEATYELTRGASPSASIPEPGLDHHQGALIRRDVDLIAELSGGGRPLNIERGLRRRRRGAENRAYANRPSNRFEAMRRLSDAASPPGSSSPGDPRLTTPTQRCSGAPATRGPSARAHPPAPASEVLPVFEERIEEAGPRAAKRIRTGSSGPRRQDERERPSARHGGHGVRWEAVQSLFDVHAQARAEPRSRAGGGADQERLPQADGQGRLFDI